MRDKEPVADSTLSERGRIREDRHSHPPSPPHREPGRTKQGQQGQDKGREGRGLETSTESGTGSGDLQRDSHLGPSWQFTLQPSLGGNSGPATHIHYSV